MINKTQLNLTNAEEREIVHRDYIAHCLRWSHIVRQSKIGEKILDIGCADAPLAMMYYTNKFKPSFYIGIDIREKLIENNKKLVFNFPVEFVCCNVIQPFDSLISCNDFSVITMLEVLEHVEKDDGLKILNNIVKLMNENTTFFLSTPCCDGHKAANHVYEWSFQELMLELTNLFKITSVHGTFASQREIKPFLSIHELKVFNDLHDYYDSNLLSIIFAPLHPEQSRNCLWELNKK